MKGYDVLHTGRSPYNAPTAGENGVIAVKWQFRTGGSVYSSPAIDGYGNVYIGSDDGLLYCISASGNLKWTYNATNWIER
jgi:outer membrane protein assembly factor BamB